MAQYFKQLFKLETIIDYFPEIQNLPAFRRRPPGKIINFLKEQYNITSNQVISLNFDRLKKSLNNLSLNQYLDKPEMKLNNTDNDSLKYDLIMFYKRLEDREIFKPSQSGISAINKTLFDFRIRLYNFLVSKFEKQDLSVNQTYDDLVAAKDKFKQDFNLFCTHYYFTFDPINFEQSILSKPQFPILKSLFDKMISIKLLIDPNFILAPDLNEFNNNIIPRDFKDIYIREKELFNQDFEFILQISAKIFQQQFKNLNLIKTIELIGDQQIGLVEIDIPNVATWTKDNYFLNSKIPNNIKIPNTDIIDYILIKKQLVKSKIMTTNQSIEKILQDNKIYKDVLALALFMEILKNPEENMGLIEFEMEIDRDIFKHKYKITIPFETSYFTNISNIQNLTKEIFKTVTDYIHDEEERYAGMGIVGITVLKARLELYKLDISKAANYVYAQKMGHSVNFLCLLKAVIYFLKQKHIKIAQFDYEKSEKILQFLHELPTNIQNKLILGDITVIKELETHFNLSIPVLNLNNYTYATGYFSMIKNKNQHFILFCNNHASVHDSLPRPNYYSLKPKMDPHPYSLKLKQDYIYISWDLETYEDTCLLYGNQIPYCLCTWSSNDYFQQVFWGLNCVVDFINFIHNYSVKNPDTYLIFWAHNGSKFDNQFIFPVLLNIYGESLILLGTTTNKKCIKAKKLIFNDFCCFFQNSLNNVCKSFGVKQKLEIDIKKITKENYQEMQSEIIEYCSNDAEILFNCVEKFTCIIKDLNIKNFDFTFSNMPTASSFAFEILRDYVTQSKITINGHSNRLYDIEKSSYHGGYTLVFKTYCDFGFIYDINSSYPNCLRGDLPYEVDKSFIFNSFNYTVEDYDLCLITYSSSKPQYFSIFPTVDEDGGLLYLQTSVGEKWHWGVEIKFAVAFGYNIQVHDVIRYKKMPIFKNFIETYYNKRLEEKNKPEPNKVLAETYKLILNSIYGKMGQRKYHDQCIMTKEKITNLIMPNIVSIENIDDNYYLVKRKKIFDEYNWVGSLVRIASFVTAKARVNLFEPFIQGDITFDNLFYCDTDSLFLNCQLPDKYLSNTELGKFKLENKFQKFYAVCPKLYTYITVPNMTEVCKIKSGKRICNNNEQFNHEKIMNLSLNFNSSLTIQNTQFTRTKDNSIKVSTVEKIITNSYVKRRHTNNYNTEIHDCIDSYINYKATMLVKKPKQNNKKTPCIFKYMDSKTTRDEEQELNFLANLDLEKLIYLYIEQQYVPVLDKNHKLYKYTLKLKDLEALKLFNINASCLYYILTSPLTEDNSIYDIIYNKKFILNSSLNLNDISWISEFNI